MRDQLSTTLGWVLRSLQKAATSQLFIRLPKWDKLRLAMQTQWNDRCLQANTRPSFKSLMKWFLISQWNLDLNQNQAIEAKEARAHLLLIRLLQQRVEWGLRFSIGNTAQRLTHAICPQRGIFDGLISKLIQHFGYLIKYGSFMPLYGYDGYDLAKYTNY